MKKQLLILCSLLFSTGLMAQKLKTVKEKHTEPYTYTEIYQVLKDDRSVRHGSYELKATGTKLKEGQYTNGKKSGIWTVFNSSKKEAYYKYDYDANKLVQFAKDVEGVDEKNTDYDTPPLAIDGTGALLRIIYSNLNYPPVAREKGISGTVVLQLKLSAMGTIESYEVLRSDSDILTQAFIDTIESQKAYLQWLPATKDGKNVASYYALPAKFRLH